MRPAVIGREAARSTRIDPEQRKLSVNESVICAELDEEAVLLNVETGVYFGLDPIGSRIWTLLAEGATEEEIFHRLLAEYEVEPAQLRSDLPPFLNLLAAKGLAQAVHG